MNHFKIKSYFHFWSTVTQHTFKFDSIYLDPVAYVCICQLQLALDQ